MNNEKNITKEEILNKYVYDRENGKLFSRYQPSKTDPVGTEHPNGYIRVAVNDNDQYTLHQLIWILEGNELPDGDEYQIDHIDQDKLNNRIGNLRVVTRTQNARNKPIRTDNQSGYVGVHFHKPRQVWYSRVRVTINGKRVDYQSPVQSSAAMAYLWRFAKLIELGQLEDRINEVQEYIPKALAELEGS